MHGTARLAQSAERKALNLVVVGSSPTVGVFHQPPHMAVAPFTLLHIHLVPKSVLLRKSPCQTAPERKKCADPFSRPHGAWAEAAPFPSSFKIGGKAPLQPTQPPVNSTVHASSAQDERP